MAYTCGCAKYFIEVKVTLPLLRGLPGQPESASTTSPMSVITAPRDADESIDKLRKQVVGKKVALWGFDIHSVDAIAAKSAQVLKESITKFLTSWYGLEVVPIGAKSNIIIANEADEAAITTLLKQNTLNRKTPTVLVLCSHTSRFDRTLAESDEKGNIGWLAKPLGPLKLARALLQCLEGAPPIATPNLSDPTSALSDSNDLSSVFEELSLSPRGGEVLDNSRMTADSANARKAIESPTPGAVPEKAQEFPFPAPTRPELSKPHSMPSSKDDLESAAAPLAKIPSVASVILTDMEKNKKDAALAPPEQPLHQPLQPPCLLLVDDNKINLTLLRTYMRKRKYDVVDEAENGLEAVNKFDDQPEGYDIVFMDISMPVLDGFGATRQIRAIEEARRKKARELVGDDTAPESSKGPKPEPKGKTPALVIALTGLASSRDQSEAFSSGIDLFLTKPVCNFSIRFPDSRRREVVRCVFGIKIHISNSYGNLRILANNLQVAFREVGKMLDNWEANRERESRASDSSSK